MLSEAKHLQYVFENKQLQIFRVVYRERSEESLYLVILGTTEILRCAQNDRLFYGVRLMELVSFRPVTFHCRLMTFD